MKFQDSLSFAKKIDRKDPLRRYRKQFLIPLHRGRPALYFNGNSLGLQPKDTKKTIKKELKNWHTLASQGHFYSKNPWVQYHEPDKIPLAKLVGAKPSEVVIMNQLTVNLHLMMVSFYRPIGKRRKIIIENNAFPSDRYAVVSHLKYLGINPEKALIELSPRQGEHCLHTEDIIRTIESHAGQLALVLLGGINYYTGQFFDLPKITKAGQRVGSLVGFDLAHAVGNVPLSLHRDKVDFAVWCGYKYLNGGPGGVAGAFIHNRHSNDSHIPRFAGWWGQNEKQRFQMKKDFRPTTGADGWQLSNVSILSGAAHRTSLALFAEAGIQKIRKKSILLTGYLSFLLDTIDPSENYFTVITPTDPERRGSQLSLLMKKRGKQIFNTLSKNGVIADWRAPNVIRVAPAPLYNTYEEVYRFVQLFSTAINPS